MSIIGSNVLAGASGQGGGYVIENSLRLRASASAYLSRTPATAGNRKTWTWSGWVKRGAIGSRNVIFSAQSTNEHTIRFEGDSIQVFRYQAGVGYTWNLVTSSVYRDPSAWYHIVVAYDTTQATASNRVKIFVNGEQVTSFSTANYPTQNSDYSINGAELHTLGKSAAGATYFDGYLTEVNFIDGQALTSSDFGDYNIDTGVWQPAKYVGTYGTNGFYLNFSDNTTTTTLGYDQSTNTNNWTANNISLTAGATYDSMLDAPLGAGGGERGNYAVMNPVDQISTTVTNGNLQAVSSASSTPAIRATIGVSSGKYYWEVLYSAGTNNAPHIGVADALAALSTTNSVGANSWNYYGFNGNKWNNGTSTAYGASYTTGDVIGVALDMDAGTLTFYKNNTSQGTAFTGLTGKTLTANLGNGTGGGTQTFQVNFGQRPFAYTPPAGFKSLHTGNLPDSAIENGAEYMAATLYTSTISGGNKTISGGAFQPDFVWVKDRSAASSNQLFDSVRGATKTIYSNLTDAEVTDAIGLISFNSDGFTLGTNGGINYQIASRSYVGWQWKAGGTAVTNTAGSITSQVSASPTAGFSIVSWTSNGNGSATVGHGLGVTPKIVIYKDRTAASDWYFFTTIFGSSLDFLRLNTTGAKGTSTNSITSTTFHNWFGNTNNLVAYCFSEVPGYSKFGSYTGNGSADGPFVYCGFRPRYVMVKRTDFAENWYVYDSVRNTFNVANLALFPNNSGAESAGYTTRIDFLSNGFKFRANTGESNGSGATYIFMAFAEAPFKNSLAR